MLRKKNLFKKFSVFELFSYIFLTLLLFLVVYPFICAFFGSFKNLREILVSRELLPNKFLWDNYIQAWSVSHFDTYTWNSIWYTAVCVFASIISSSMGGYVFARGEFVGKKIIFAVLSSMMFVVLGSSSLAPQIEILKKLGLGDTLWGPAVMTIFGVNIANTYLVRSFVNSLPLSLDESAEIDGCGFFKTFMCIILPMLKPVIATVAIFAFGSAWNDYLIPMIVTLSNPAERPLSVGMIALKGSSDAAVAWNLILAGAMMSALPMIIVYLCFNKFFIKGVAAGAVKG